MTSSGSHTDLFHDREKECSETLLLRAQYHSEESPTDSNIIRPPDNRGFRENPQIRYRIEDDDGKGPQVLGRGGYSMIFRAEDLKSGQVVALKKSRVPLRVKRPILQYESRVLRMLQGHPAIPELYGYGHLLSALKHVHKHGLVHRDVKPENLLCSNNDASKIMLIDFGLAKPIRSGPPKTCDPIKEKKRIVGTLHWASLNSHRGIDLGPGDDLESLAYTALFLLRGKLPWRNYQRWGREYPTEPFLRSQFRIYRSKVAVSGSQLVMNFPADFAHLLDYSRGLSYHQIPDYDELEGRFSQLGKSLGGYSKCDPLDWTSIPAIATESSVLDEDNFDKEDDIDYEEEDDKDSDSEVHENSYGGTDMDCWDDVHSSRDVSLTLPTDVEEVVESRIPTINEVRNR
ncbi:hypothetical protein Clacol_001748 [Clathrus columnatus]|uniref:non-specific serine/threonine protein kinase n=1 Tax=Clathrus columnatus TaxID=1419009 RepID=A0AAV4ZYY4_9AGAM|nr:hypothetical protein Clacol_001748 [Clathrus columnatus]